MIRPATVLLLCVSLGACGSRTQLTPQAGMSAVPKAATAPRAETPRELMTPSTQARPERNADLLTRSQERPDDPFNLPPDETNGT